MTSWSDAVDAFRDQFVASMRALGFWYVEENRDAPTLRGSLRVAGHDDDVQLEVSLREGFPYLPPKVRPVSVQTPGTWHRERDGTLCLWTGQEDDLPWMRPDHVIERIQGWFERQQVDWVNDEPDLDLERYFPPVENGPKLVVYKNLESLLGKRFKTRRRRFEVVEIVPSTAATFRRKHGWAIDLGELERPVSDWNGVAERLGDRAEVLRAQFSAAGGGYLLAAYSRGEYRAAVVLRVEFNGGRLEVGALPSADESAAVAGMRAGDDRHELSGRCVAVVGLGAIGSYVADLLARSGIGRLVLCDGDRLRPGNCVRHLAGKDHIGRRKVTAVRAVISDGIYHPPEIVDLPAHVVTPEEAETVTGRVDIIVDATGSPPTTALLAEAARTRSLKCISVYIQREGGIVRIDRWPPDGDEAHLPPIPPPSGTRRTPLREAGCGAPVSPTPPHSVTIAASLATRIVADALCSRPVPNSVVQVLQAQEDEPYQRTAFLVS